MKELTVEARLEQIPQVTAWIDAELEALECPMKAQLQIDVAIDEIFSNIARYAYGEGTGSATVRFDFDPAARVAAITFEGSGTPYDPLAKEDPDISLGAQERSAGGLGIFLVKKTMDGMHYRYENGKNILTLQKKI